MILFQNSGEIDINAVKTMGVSVKEEGSIGFFGTGLKFAIAVLLRHKQKITIYAGQETYSFGTKSLTIRGQSFDLITLNGQELGFTTELGKTWEMWMAFRELYCNCLDEGGSISETTDFPVTEEDLTSIVVSGEKIEQEYHDKGNTFILSAPLFSTSNVAIHDGSRKSLYYRTVRAYDPVGRSGSIYTYNLKSKQELTEDRTLKYHYSALNEISKAIMQLEDPHIVRRIITAPIGRIEADLVYDPTWDMTEIFKNTVIEEYRKNPDNINKSLMPIVKRSRYSGGVYVEVQMTEVQKKQLAKAIEFCSYLGYELADYRVKTVETLGPTVMAVAEPDIQEIILSKRCFDCGTKFLASTLLEEIIHIREGLMDETRALQTYLFDRIISLGEEMRGEPL